MTLRDFRKLFAVLLLIATHPSGSSAQSERLAAGGNGHLLNEDCAGCHVGGGPVTSQNAGKLIASQEKLCNRCHAEAMKASHPSGIPVKRGTPAELPLDWKGDMTCSTCHTIHSPAPGLMRTAKKGREFCQMCHEPNFFKGIRDGGASLMNAGHLQDTSATVQNIDGYTLLCIECHNKELTAPNVIIDNRGVVRHASGSSNHPVGVSYRRAFAFGGYRPVNSLPEQVLLPEGRLSCTSCHLGYSHDHGKLVRPYPGMCSTLCHDL